MRVKSESQVVLTPVDPSICVKSIWSHGGSVGQSSIVRIKTSTHLVALSIIDLRVFSSVTDGTENGRIASVRAPNDKDPEAAKFLSDVFKTADLVCV
jgi:hypothetical protein